MKAIHFLIANLIFLNVIPPYLPAKSVAESDQIVVRLETDIQLLPLFAAKITNDNSNVDSSLLLELDRILQFDLNHNGMTYTVANTPDKEKLANSLLVETTHNDRAWKIIGAPYVIKVSIQKEGKISAALLSSSEGSIKHFAGLALSGHLNQDRKQIHLLADAIHKALFGSEGIASTRFLYTVKKHVITGVEKKWVSDIWEADYDGANARQLTKDNGYNITPVYIPPKTGAVSGSYFYVAYKNAQPKIYMASLQNGAGRRFSMLGGNQLLPAISRQRDKVAFISDVTGHPDLFVQAFNPESGAIDKPQQVFAWKQATQGSPTFSPDGKRLAFVSNKDGTPRVYVMDIPAPGISLKDVKTELVTKNNKESSAPAWSPDGTKIAYCSMTNGIRQIWLYDLHKKMERQLTQGAGNKENPTWGPNSLNLIYNSSDADASELYLININQPSSTQISSGAGEKRFPNWEPRFFK